MLVERDKAVSGDFSLDGNNKFPRIERLLAEYWGHKPTLDIERARIYTQSFKETEGERIIIRRAKAYKKYMEERRISISDYQLILGDTAYQPRWGTVAPEMHCGWLSEEIDTISTKKTGSLCSHSRNSERTEGRNFSLLERKDGQ